MYIKRNKTVNIQCNFYCGSCRQRRADDNAPFKIEYCDITGEYLEKTKDGRTLKTIDCLTAIRQQLKGG